jgi:predicted  nucleic acid-binding Zn-ribbon protein
MTHDYRLQLVNEHTRSGLRLWALLISLVAVTGLTIAAVPQKSPCDGVIAALGKAQGDYNRARSARIKAEGDLNRAKNNVKSIATKIKANEAQQSKARCDNANGDLAPLSGSCATVPARIDKAKKDIAALRAEHGRLEDQRTAAEMDVERNEREFAAKQAAESAAQTALDQAKKNAAGCRRAA